MPKPPRRTPPRTRKTNAVVERVAGPPIVARPADPRQAGLFDLPLPGWMRPCLLTLVDKPPAGPQWVHEIKWDGYRVSVYVEAGKVTIRTRNGHDWTRRFPAIALAAAALKVRSAVLDGEAVILDDRGRSSFAELQADLDKHGSDRAVLYAFDLLFLDGGSGSPASSRPAPPSCSARTTPAMAPSCSASRVSRSSRASFPSGSTSRTAAAARDRGSRPNACLAASS